MSRRQLPVLLERDLIKIRTERYLRSEMFMQEVRSTIEEMDRVISCSPGCSACCHHPVTLNLLEGILLHRWLAEHGLLTADLWAKLQKHAKETWALSHEIWFLSNIPCPLLANDRCMAYEGRPFVCRTTVSIGDPIYCHPHRHGPQTGIIPRSSVMQDFEAMAIRKLRDQGLNTLQLSLSKALLVAEAVLSGTLEFDAIASFLAKDFRTEG